MRGVAIEEGSELEIPGSPKNKAGSDRFRRELLRQTAWRGLSRLFREAQTLSEGTATHRYRSPRWFSSAHATPVTCRGRLGWATGEMRRQRRRDQGSKAVRSDSVVR